MNIHYDLVNQFPILQQKGFCFVLLCFVFVLFLFILFLFCFVVLFLFVCLSFPYTSKVEMSDACTQIHQNF